MKERKKLPIGAENKWQCWSQLLPLSNYLKIQCEILGLNSGFGEFNGRASSGTAAMNPLFHEGWLKMCQRTSGAKDEKEFLSSNLHLSFNFACILNNVSKKSCVFLDGLNKNWFFFFFFFYTCCLNKHEAPPLWLHVLSIYPGLNLLFSLLAPRATRKVVSVWKFEVG